MPDATKLGDLFLAMFELDDLRLFLAGTFGSRLVQEIEWSGSASIQTWNVARALEQRGLVDRKLMDALVAARPAVAGEVRRVFGVSIGGHASLRILHLSDLHLSAATTPNHDALLRAALDPIRGLAGEGLAPDFVAITGDLVQSGSRAEFDLVERWLTGSLLPALELDAKALLIVPGNHDMDREVVRKGETGDLDDLARADREKADNYLKNPARMREFHLRYAEYVMFLGRIGVAHPREPSWTWRKAGSFPLFFAGLDTAWLHSRDVREGDLVLGRRAVDLALNERRDGEVVVALTHHPLDWLARWDRDDVEPPFMKHVHVHLHGHVHRSHPRSMQSPAGMLVTLENGAMYAGHRWANGFQLVEVSAAGGRVHPFTWIRDDERWARDRTRFGDEGQAFTWSE